MEPKELEKNAETAATILNAISNPRRLMILCKLMEQETSVNALSEALELGQSALSQHLAKLRHAGIVDGRRSGQTIYYRIISDDAQAILQTLYERFCTDKSGSGNPASGESGSGK